MDGVAVLQCTALYGENDAVEVMWNRDR